MTTWMSAYGRLVSVIALAALTACGGGGPLPARSVAPLRAHSTVRVTLRNYSVSPDRDSVPAGRVTFEATAVGKDVSHNLSILRTDLAPGALPTLAAGNVDPTAQGIRSVGFTPSMGGGESQSLTVNLPPGHYVLVCNLVNHYSLGMHTAFEVR